MKVVVVTAAAVGVFFCLLAIGLGVVTLVEMAELLRKWR